ncbi:MAG: glycosyltransferase family protein [Thermoguttaceae bacterium]
MILAILQARLSSTRLPGKVLKPILGEPMLARQIERVRRAETLDRLIVATSVEASDDPVEQACGRIGVDCFRGSLADVLDRYYQAARQWSADHVVRLTGDCPLTDPALIDEVVAHYQRANVDYASNVLQRTFPKGLDVEALSFATLERAWREAVTSEHREHVTLFVRERPDRFTHGSFRQEADFSHLRWTVDEPEDFEFTRRVFEELYPTNPCFDRSDVLELLRRKPELAEINAACGEMS